MVLWAWLSQAVLAQTSTKSVADPTTTYRSIFTVPASADVGQPLLPNIKDPQAVNAQTVCPGYIASGVQQTDNGITAYLDLAGPPCNLYGNDIENLTLLVEYQATDRVHIEIQPRYLGPNNESWFLLPEQLVPKPGTGSCSAGKSDLIISWSNDPTFSFTVKRQQVDYPLFTTSGSVIVFEDQFVEFGSPLPEQYNLYGLGESIHDFRLSGNVSNTTEPTNLTRTLFNADAGDPIDGNIYGTHPIYLDTRYYEEGSAGSLTYVTDPSNASASYTSLTHGVFLRNAHAHEVLLGPYNVTWRTLGGTIDLYVYSGPSATDVMRSYQQSTIGLPAMVPYWSLGFHQCRWGYRNWTEVQDVVDNFKDFDIPLDVIWTDIDYMNQYRDFENDLNTFPYDEGKKFLSQLHANDQHYIPIVDSAIYDPNPTNDSDAYPTYNRGVDASAFMLNPDGSLYIGEVWPGYTVFPDWIGAVLNGSGSFEWWTNEMTRWHQNVSFDGIWIDMSEVSSFCVGSCGSNNLTMNPVHPGFQLPGEPGNQIVQYPEGFNLTNATEASSASSVASAQSTAAAASSTSTRYLRTTPTPGVRNINYPPYVINNVQGDLAVHAVSPNATHHGGTQEYDFHNLFGYQILNATYNALLHVFPEKRPFIIGRSTFAGSGRWAGHWGGDNTSLWAYMYFSISQALSFSIFGIPMFGVDTCGFGGNTDLELCSRWMQLSAFFPFYRNHNSLGSISQEPYRWEAVADASRKAMAIRYSILPYLYTLMANAHYKGDTVMRALAWEFPTKPWLKAADAQFMLGPAIMVTPCLEQGANSTHGVFPGLGDGKRWYDWYNQSAVAIGVGRESNVSLDSPLGHIPVFVRGGYILPMQEPALTTAAGRRTPWSVLVALDEHQAAQGELYLDDGVSQTPNATSWVTLSAGNSTLHAQPSGNYSDTNALANVTVMGVKMAVSSASLNNQALQSSSWKYDETSQVLKFTQLSSMTAGGAWASSWTLSWQ